MSYKTPGLSSKQARLITPKKCRTKLAAFIEAIFFVLIIYICTSFIAIVYVMISFKMLVFILLTSYALEAAGLVIKNTRLRSLIAAACSILIVIATFFYSSLLSIEVNPWLVSIIVVSIFRLINVWRLIRSRVNEVFLRKAVGRTSLCLGILFVLLLIFLRMQGSINSNMMQQVLFIVLVQFLSAVVLFVNTIRTLKKSSFEQAEANYADKDLPTVSVLIPARNETETLQQCIESVIAVDYPKLEILVLDDCSQDKTPNIIKDLAHRGVRFVSGGEPSDRWLPKNYAYEKLFTEASGEFLLFIGADTRLGRSSIKVLINTVLTRNKSMISVLPQQAKEASRNIVVQSMRYFWEISLPRRPFNLPPVLSTCWLIDTKVLKDLGGLAAVRGSVVPERYFARELAKSDSYSFMRSSGMMQVFSNKKFADQVGTGFRTAYPLMRRRPENVLMVSALEILILIGPFAFIGLGLLGYIKGVAFYLPMASAFILWSTYSLVISASSPKSLWLGPLFPISVLIMAVIRIASMMLYEFGKVNWKGRNICLPVMQVIPYLPKF